MALLLTLLHGIWAIQPEAIHAYEPVIQELIKNPSADLSKLLPKRRSFNLNIGAANTPLTAPMEKGGFSLAPKNSIAVISLSGPVMKDDWCGDPGTKTMSALMSEADNNPNIIGQILILDTPGGAVDGTPNFADNIKSLNKPVVGLIDGMCCSAGMWIVSATDHIMSTHDINTVGSIGTMCSMRDYSGRDENNGIKNHFIYATNSTDKNKAYHDALKGDYAPMIEQLDQMNDMFTSAIKKNRWNKGVTKEVLTGKTYLSKDAISKGLVDSIGSMSDAVNKVKQLSKS